MRARGVKRGGATAQGRWGLSILEFSRLNDVPHANVCSGRGRCGTCRVHVDAGAYGATNGDRILRFFVNVNPARDRVWATKGSFEDVVSRHGSRAGLLDDAGRLRVNIEKRGGDRVVSALVAGLAQLNPLATVLDTSPYDRAMRRLHNYMKDDAEFRADMEGYEEIRFPPLSAWMVFTDGVSHASLEGQFALVTTMIVRRDRMRWPERAPFNALLARASGARPAA